MTKAQLSALIRGLVPALRDYIAACQQPIHERLTALETQERLAGPQGKEGPAGQDGAPGRDGSLDGATVVSVDVRTYEWRAADGRVLGRMTFPVPLYCGVYVAGTSYVKGDSVTFGGSLWIAKDATREKPGDGVTAWQLAVKAGREGREGKQGPQGPQGPAGAHGAPGRNFS